MKPNSTFLALYEDEKVAREVALLTAGKPIGALPTKIELKPLGHAILSPSYMDVNSFFKAVGIESTTPFLLHISALPPVFTCQDIRNWIPQKIHSIMERDNSFLLQFESDSDRQAAYADIVGGVHFLRSRLQTIQCTI